MLSTAFVAFGTSSCQTSNKDKASASDSTQHTDNRDWTASELAGNYSFLEHGDTITLDIQNQNDSLIGPLNYKFKEKDQNMGTFKGVIQDSLLVGEYSFMSEGVTSVRQAVFGIVREGLIEGFGDIEDTGEKVVFTNMDSLKFDHGMILKKN